MKRRAGGRLPPGARAVIDLVNVSISADVRQRQTAGTVCIAPYASTARVLKPGANQLRIVVATRWPTTKSQFKELKDGGWSPAASRKAARQRAAWTVNVEW